MRKTPRYSQIEKWIEECISELKPELQSRFLYGFRYDDKIVGDAYAVTQYFLKLPTVTFFTNKIRRAYNNKDQIRELVSHEVLHVLGYGHTDEMYKKVKTNKLYARTS